MRNSRRPFFALATVGGAALLCLTGCTSEILPDTVTIAGDTETPLRPGLAVPIDLRITNHHPVLITVSALRVEIIDIYAPRSDPQHPCTSKDYAISQSRQATTIEVAARSSVWLSSASVPRAEWPTVAMVGGSLSQDGCRGASVTLRYTAHTTMGSEMSGAAK